MTTVPRASDPERSKYRQGLAGRLGAPRTHPAGFLVFLALCANTSVQVRGPLVYSPAAEQHTRVPFSSLTTASERESIEAA